MFSLFHRVYNQPSDEDLESLQTCQLLDEWEQELKSLKNYKESVDHILTKHHVIQLYLQKNLLPFPADWPGWYYPKKLIANNCSGKYSSIIPEQGQFHVSLNAVEDTVLIFKLFFDKLFSHLFGGVLQKRPRPYQSSLCVTAALLGWLMVREKVLQKFGLCKSHEFVSTLYLLEDVVPLVYFQYQIFRSGNLDLYISVMSQMAILFNIWRRKHYDKSTLSFLSDWDYQKNFLANYWQCKKQWLYLFVEKKIEIWHSLLRAHTQSQDDATAIVACEQALWPGLRVWGRGKGEGRGRRESLQRCLTNSNAAPMLPVVPRCPSCQNLANQRKPETSVNVTNTLKIIFPGNSLASA